MNIKINGVNITLTKEQLKEIAKQTSNKYTLDDLISYEKACEIINVRVRLVTEFYDFEEWYLEQIKIIIRAANYIDNNNQLWKPKFNNTQSNYLPWLEKTISGWRLFSSYYCSDSSHGGPAYLFYKEESTCKLIYNRFSELYSNMIG